MKTKCSSARRLVLKLLVAAALLLPSLALYAAQAPVDLGTAGNYAILAKSGISTVPPSAIIGDIATSPIDSTAITGFSLALDSTTTFATSTQVTGRVFAPDYTAPTPSILTTAVGDMELAFTDAAGRAIPDFTELGAGDIGGLTLAPGLYKWGTGVSIPTDVTLEGGADDVWIFQIAGNVTMASAKTVHLSGGARAQNIFWQVSGGVGVTIGTESHFEGIVLAQAGIDFQTGATINGRLLSQTAVTLDANSVVAPGAAVQDPAAPHFGPIARDGDGTVNLSLTNTPTVRITIQHSPDLLNWTLLDQTTPTTSPYMFDDATTGGAPMRFYRAFYPAE